MAQMVTVVVDVLLSASLLLLLLLLMFFNVIPRKEREKNRFSFPLNCIRTSQATSHFEYIYVHVIFFALLLPLVLCPVSNQLILILKPI